jgi:alginate O-acetyltransferase complex protein AlgF
MRLNVVSFLLSLFVFVAMPAYAADSDAGLYAPVPPAGSSFVRFFNPTAQPITVKIGNKSYGEIAPMMASSYFVQPQGDTAFKVGKDEIHYAVSAGNFYTVVTDAGGNTLIHQDALIEDVSRALIVFYNLGNKGPLNLKAKDGMITVIEKAAPGKSGYRGINPVKVDFSIFDAEGKKLQSLEPVILERGHVYSVFFAGEKAVVVKGETDTTR